MIEKEINWLLSEKYGGQRTKQAERDIKKLKKGEPLAYLIGNIPFLNCLIDLRFKPLIPRPETEHWVNLAIEEIKKRKEEIKCLDLFSGSGCIGIALLKNTTNTYVDFGEISRKQLKQIKINLDLNNISENRYQLIRTNIFNKVNDKYKYIFANPPYISKKDKVDPSVLKHEPKGALLAGKDGLKYVNPFLRLVRQRIEKNGKIYLEFGFNQKNAIEKLLKKWHYCDYEFFKDQYGKWRYIIIKY